MSAAQTSEAGIREGVRIRVRSGPPEAHCRTPGYLRGKEGVVVAEIGVYRDPARLAYHKPGLPMRRLFRIRFAQRDLWPDYGPQRDTLFADLYESWLEAVETEASRQDAHDA